MGWLEDSGHGLRGAAAREARKNRAAERAADADLALVNGGPTGAAAREARKQKLAEQAAENELSGAAARQKRKERQAAKEEAEKKLKQDANAARLRRVARAQSSRGKAIGEDGVDDIEESDAARRARLAERIAARRATVQEQDDGKDDEDNDEDADEEEEGEEEASDEKEEPAEPPPSAEKKHKKVAKTAGSDSSGGEKVRQNKKKKKKKKKKKDKKKKKKKDESDNSSSSPSMEAWKMAQAMAMQDIGSFSWERKPGDVAKKFEATDFDVMISAATPEEVNKFLEQSSTMETAVATRFRCLAPALQKIIIDRGPICNSRNPSSVLAARCRDAELGKLGAPGQKAPDKVDAIEKIITKYSLDVNCSHRLRHETKELQDAVIKLERSGDVDKCTNPSGLLMAKLNELRPPDHSKKVAPNHQVVVYQR